MASASFADRLNHLVAVIPGPEGGKWTNINLVQALARNGVTVSEAYISQLRHGKRDNPTRTTIIGLAAAFDVPAAYFLDDEVSDRINTQLEQLAWLRDSDIQSIAIRARGISPEGLSNLASIVEHIRSVEGLPDTPRSENESDR